MILLNYRDRLFRFFIYISIVFITFFLITTFTNINSNKIERDVTPSSIIFNNKNTQINVEYPRYKNDRIKQTNF